MPKLVEIENEEEKTLAPGFCNLIPSKHRADE